MCNGSTLDSPSEFDHSTSNYRKKVSKQFSAQAFNRKSLPNEIIIALEYFEHKRQDKKSFDWGQVNIFSLLYFDLHYSSELFFLW